MSDIVERLRQYESRLERESADEIERLRAQNAILLDTIDGVLHVMASAPAWHAMHREAIEGLQKVKKEMEQ